MMMLTLLVNIFDQLFLMAESCVEVYVAQLWVIAIFEQQHFTSSVATHWRCGGIFNYHFSRNLLVSLLVKNLKIG